jgi:hypothetical protein
VKSSADEDSSLAARADEDSPVDPAAEPPPPPLELGGPEGHVAALDALLLGSATFTVGTEDTTPGLLMIDESYFVSKLASETGKCVGALLLDGPTATLLGSAIRGLSKEETEAEAAAATPGEVVLAGIKDLAAAMVNVLEKIAGNPTVFACDVEKLDPIELPWLFDTQKRVDLDDSLGGHVLLIAK